MWDPNSLTRDGTCVASGIPNHWTTREVLTVFSYSSPNDLRQEMSYVDIYGESILTKATGNTKLVNGSRPWEEPCAGATWKRGRVVRTEFAGNERPDHVTCHAPASPRHPASLGADSNVTWSPPALSLPSVKHHIVHYDGTLERKLAKRIGISQLSVVSAPFVQARPPLRHLERFWLLLLLILIRKHRGIQALKLWIPPLCLTDKYPELHGIR